MRGRTINHQASTSLDQSRWRRRFLSTGLLALFLLAGCGHRSSDTGVVQKTPATTAPVGTGNPIPTGSAVVSNEMSIVNFTLRGGVTGLYMIQASLPTSKLRHGFREFTVDVADAEMSIYVAFYGYHGPGTYTLSEGINGGDVRINFYRQAVSWDLSLRPKAQCALVITSVTPTIYTGIERLRGDFSCPLLPSSSPNNPQRPVAVSDGHIDVAIIAES